MNNMGRFSVLYIDPEGIAEAVLSDLKTRLFAEDGAEESFVVEETNLPFRDLLAKTRRDAAAAGVDCPGFCILNKESAAKQAVLCVEVSVYVGEVKGYGERFPSASTTRRFYSTPESAYMALANFDIANMDWGEVMDNVKGLGRGAVLDFMS